MHLKFRNVNDSFTSLVARIHNGTIPTTKKPSRVGEVLTIEEPVTITYERPIERVLFNVARDANPFFHAFESMWMLAGRNDLAPLQYYVSTFDAFSDDGKILNGAYGHRWRKAECWNPAVEYPDRTFVDQLNVLVEHLKQNPGSRRAVLQMWNVEDDLLKLDTSRDVCCNLSVMFSLREVSSLPGQVLDMTVTNRSNDLCLAKGTKFRSPEGDETIENLASKFQTEKGFKFPVYTIDTVTGDQNLAWMSNAWRTGVKPVFKIGFDDGSFVRLTGDHVLFKKTKVFDGKRCIGLKIEERQACELKVGDRVVAELPEKASSKSLGGYLFSKLSIFSGTSHQNMLQEHRRYWEFVTGDNLETADEIHHRDEDKANNRFDNLERLTKQEHRSYHLSKDNPNNKMTPEQVFERASKGGRTHKGKVVGQETRAKLSAAAKARAIREKDKRDESGRFISNHKVVSIEPDGYSEVYDFTVPGRHNAVLANGVLVHNCWGMLGANVCHFSVLQEYMAARLGVKLGVYNQFSNNLHVYTERWEPGKWLDGYGPNRDMHSPRIFSYEKDVKLVVPLVHDPATFEEELPAFVTFNAGAPQLEWRTHWQEPFLDKVAQPLLYAFHFYKQKDFHNALTSCANIIADDWRLSARNWVAKRKAKWDEKSQ